MKILLNIAHTEDTPGKRSPDGKFREFYYSTEICNLIVNKLRYFGYDADIITQDTYYGSVTGLKQVVDDVNKICDKLGAKNVILISVHVNAAANGTWGNATGWAAYTTKGKTKSDTLADDLYWAAEQILTPKNKKIRTDKSDGDKDYEDDFYLLKKCKCPAVLTENFFQDNKKDVEYLSSKEGKKDIVNIHVDGIIAYLQKTL